MEISLKKAAKECSVSYADAKAILDYMIAPAGTILSDYAPRFKKKDNEYYFQDWDIDYLKDMFARFHHVKYSTKSNVLGYTFNTYTDGTQNFYAVKDIIEAFDTTEYDLNKHASFYDFARGIIVNSNKNRIKKLITEHGVYSFLFWYASDLLDQTKEKEEANEKTAA